MRGGGRPLRFLGVVLGGWIAMRTWLLWPEPPLHLPMPMREVLRGVIARTADPPIGRGATARTVVWRSTGRRAWRAVMVRQPTAIVPISSARASSGPSRASPDAAADMTAPLGVIRYGTPEPAPPRLRRWSASGWTILRGAGRGGGVATPQLGGSQAGLRLSRTIDSRGRVAIAARFASAIDIPQQEAAIGIEWKPTRLPVRVVAERRLGLANVIGGTALGMVGGVSGVVLPAGLRLDAYAQVGAILRDRVDGYADGAIQVGRPVFRTRDGVALDLGAGAWGAAQRGASRLDIGPAATLSLPIGDTVHLRIALEWRQRVLGDARPASGPAMSIGADY